MANIFKRTVKDIDCIFNSPQHDNERLRRRRRRGVMALVGFLLTTLQFVLLLILSAKIVVLDILPFKYLVIIIGVFSLLLAYCILSQFAKSHCLGKLISVFSSLLLTLGIFAVSGLNNAFDNITSTQTQTNIINIVVPSDKDYNSLADVIKSPFGINSSADSSLIEQTVETIEKDNRTNITTHSYNNWEILLNALYKNTDIKAAIMTDSIYQTLCDQYPNLAAKTTVLSTVSIETELTIARNDKDIKNASFVIYLSGNDETGSIRDTGRSDVNILAAINPKTRNILLVSTPRDYYITITNSEGHRGLDKLTHAGNYGTKSSIKALEDLYKTDIDYYGKVNFTGCIDIIDALGGITIYSDVEFYNSYDAAPKKYHFYKGANYCNGEKALAFMRERNAFASGDIQRGKNQQATLAAIIDKATSPAILTNYSKVLETGSQMVATNMPSTAITELIKAQLANPTPWTINSYNPGSLNLDARRDCYISGIKNVHVVIPDYDSVNTAITLINKTLNGEAYDITQYK